MKQRVNNVSKLAASLMIAVGASCGETPVVVKEYPEVDTEQHLKNDLPPSYEVRRMVDIKPVLDERFDPEKLRIVKLVHQRIM